MKLYTYFRSSAAYRVRIALNLKGLQYDAVPVHLLRDGGEQLCDTYQAINPSGLVPAFQDDYITLTQSMAILEYLDDEYPEPSIMPEDAAGRARVRELAQIIACDIHPVNNLRVLRYLTDNLGLSEEVKTEWYRHWLVGGLEVLEKHLARDPSAGPLCHGHTPTIADCCLVPQVYNASRFRLSWRRILRTSRTPSKRVRRGRPSAAGLLLGLGTDGRTVRLGRRRHFLQGVVDAGRMLGRHVAQRDDADHGLLLVQHRNAADLHVAHLAEYLVHGLVGPAGAHVGAHHVADHGAAGSLAGRGGAHGDVAVGDHADQPAAVEHGDGAHVEFIHHLRGALHGFLR
jgi:maleylpyruvate isomerase